MEEQRRENEGRADAAREAPPSEQGAHRGGGARVDQGSATAAPGVSGTAASDFRPGHAEPTPRTPPDEE
jgi:hypothetical protein